MARPTKYSKDILKKAKHYLEHYDSEAIGDVVPQIAGLAVYLEVSRETVYAWAKEEDKAEFSDIVEQLLGKQEQKLLNGGIFGEFNSTITKLALSKHGYHDKVDSTLSAPGGGPVEVSYVGVQSDGRRSKD